MAVSTLVERVPQPKPSVSTSDPRASQRGVPRATSRLRKALTGTSFSLRDRLTGPVETAARKGVLHADDARNSALRLCI